MRIRNLLIAAGLVAVLAVGLLAGRALEKMGNPDSATGPGVTSSYSLEDIYNRLDTGAPGSPNAFSEPTAGPSTGTMHTLNEIMAKAGTACTQCNAPGTLSAEGRWCDNDDGTVTDMTTGLVWLQKVDWGGTQPWREDGDSTHNDDAHTRAGTLYAGSTGAGLTDGSDVGDWRLPTLEELKALTTGTEPVSSENMRAFSGVQNSYYWSSTTKADYANLDHAYYVHVDSGGVHDGLKYSSYYVWPVRGP